MQLRISFILVTVLFSIPYLSKISNRIDNIFGCRRIRFCNNFSWISYYDTILE